MTKALVLHNDARRHLKVGLDQIAQAVATTLGPKGRNVALDQKWGLPTVTQDGAIIAKEIELQNHYENMGAQLLKEAATKTNDVAGDGTTTAIVLAQALVSEGLKNIAAGANPMLLKRGLEKAAAAVSAALNKQSIQICTRADMANVAAISAQSKEIGDLIAEVLDHVGPDGAVSIEEGQGLITEVQYRDGMQFAQGYLSPYFVTHAETMETVLEEPNILLYDQRISNATDLVPLLEQLVRTRNPSLVVIADEVEAEALAILVLNKVQGAFNLVAVKAPGYSNQRTALLQDMATLTGGTLISPETGRRIETTTLADLGCCDRVVVGKDNTTIFGGYGTETAIKARVGQIKRELEQSANEYDQENLRARLAKLTGAVAVIKGGAATSVELKAVKQRVEDAVRATQAAVLEGVVPGGGVALLNASWALERIITSDRDEAAGINMVRRALEAPLRLIANNAGLDGAVIVANVRRQQRVQKNNRIGYNVLSEQVQDMVTGGIIDPLKVTRSALESAASVAAMILTIDVLVTGIPEG